MTTLNMDQWLRENLACPRDRQPLEWRPDHLACSQGHQYPLIDGLPVMLVNEAEPNQPIRFANTKQQVEDPNARPHDDTPLPQGEIDPYVREILGNTCGRLYGPISSKFMRYPIPDLPLPPGQGKVILDLGSSWGRWSLAAARSGYYPVGIEPSIDRVRAARRVAKQLGLECRYLVADARYMPFKDQCFDVVFSHIVLQHFSKENAKIALKEVHRVLKIGGMSKIQMATRWGLNNQLSQLHQSLRHLRNAPNPFRVRYWPQRELQQTFDELVGPSKISSDSFFSVNSQMADLDLLYRRHRAVVRVSDFLRRKSEGRRWLTKMADSVFLTSERAR